MGVTSSNAPCRTQRVRQHMHLALGMVLHYTLESHITLLHLHSMCVTITDTFWTEHRCLWRRHRRTDGDVLLMSPRRHRKWLDRGVTVVNLSSGLFKIIRSSDPQIIRSSDPQIIAFMSWQLLFTLSFFKKITVVYTSCLTSTLVSLLVWVRQVQITFTKTKRFQSLLTTVQLQANGEIAASSFMFCFLFCLRTSATRLCSGALIIWPSAYLNTC